MKNRVLAIFLIILIAVTNFVPTYAAKHGAPAIDEYNMYDNDEEISESSEEGEKINKPEHAEVGLLKIFTKMLDGLADLVYSALLWVIENILPSMDAIVFNQADINFWGGFFRLSYFDYEYGSSLAGYLVGMVSTIYQVLRYVALIGFIIAIACIAVKTIIASVGKQKQQYKEALKNWLFGLVLLVVGHWLMIYMIYFSDFLVDFIVAIKDSILELSKQEWNQDASVVLPFWQDEVTLVAALKYVIDKMNENVWTALSGINPLMIIVGIIVFAVLNFKIAKVYFERVIVVGVLIMMFPIITVLFAFEKAGLRKGSSFETWLKTYVEQVFLQPIHALALMFVIIIIIGLANTPVMDMPIINMIFVIMAINMTFKIENVITKLIAIHAEGLGSPINPALAAGFAVAAAPGAYKATGSLALGLVDKIRGKKNPDGSKSSYGELVKNRYNNFLGDGKIGRWAKNRADSASKFFGSDYVKNAVSGALAVGGIHAPIFYGKKKGGKGGNGKGDDSKLKELKVYLELLKKNPNDKRIRNIVQERFDRYVNGFSAEELGMAQKECNVNNIHNIKDPAQFAGMIACLVNQDGVHNFYTDKTKKNIDYDSAYAEAFEGKKTITGADVAGYSLLGGAGISIITEKIKELEENIGEHAVKEALARANLSMPDSGESNAMENTSDFMKLLYAIKNPFIDKVTAKPETLEHWYQNDIKDKDDVFTSMTETIKQTFANDQITLEFGKLEAAYGEGRIEKALKSAGFTRPESGKDGELKSADDFLRFVYALEHPGASNVSKIAMSDIKKWRDNKIKS